MKINVKPNVHYDEKQTPNEDRSMPSLLSAFPAQCLRITPNVYNGNSIMNRVKVKVGTYVAGEVYPDEPGMRVNNLGKPWFDRLKQQSYQYAYLKYDPYLAAKAKRVKPWRFR